MSIPGTAGAIKTGETLGGRAAQADEQGAFRKLSDMGTKGMQEQIRINSAVNAYMELINMPKKLLPESKLQALKTVYRVYEAESTPENTARFMQQVRESIQTTTDGVKSGMVVDEAVADTVARLEWVQGNIDRGINGGDNGGVNLGSDKMLWDSWQNYEKVTINGKVYAKVGDRLYTKHAVDRMQPSGNRFGSYIYQAGGDYGRSVAPQFVEDVINSSEPIYQPKTGNLEYVSGTLKIVTDSNGYVITIMTYWN